MALRKITNKKHTRVFKIAFLKQKLRFLSLKNDKIAYIFGSDSKLGLLTTLNDSNLQLQIKNHFTFQNSF
jgi:hypothetical protein